MFPRYNNRRLNPRDIGRAVSDLRAVARNPQNGTTTRLANAAQQVRRLLGGLNGGLDAALLDLVQTAERLLRARRAGWAAGLTQALNANGNPIGAAMAQNILNRQNAAIAKTIEDKLRQVATITEQVAPELFGRPRPSRTPEQAGGTKVTTQHMPPNAVPAESEIMPDNIRRRRDGKIEVSGPGFKRVYHETSPVFTGRMLRVRSSNVHSIGYQLNPKDPAHGVMFVRFLQPDGGYGPGQQTPPRPVAGPTYGYKGVHPDLFVSFTMAASKGIFVWDNLRVRGTIHGHQYPYFLSRVSQGYVPRRIQIRNGNQIWYGTRRNVGVSANGRMQVIKNTLAARQVGTIRRRRSIG
jgi:hypothetical protein